MRKSLIMIIFQIIILSSISFSEEGRLLRYPAVSQDMIAFCYGGDVYSVPLEGGLARRLTSSDGFEIYPRFSPDGGRLAFSAEYDGNREIYTMPAKGGEPVRLTYSMDISAGLPDRMGPDKIVMQWTPDGENILYRSRKESWNAFIGKLYLVPKDGGPPRELPLPRGGFASLSPDGKKLAYNRIFREYRTWKRYRGGMADDIRLYDFESKKTEQITDNDAQDIIPLWSGDKIYFLSDRDKRMNIYCRDLKTKQTKKITRYKDYDVKFPSLGPGRIVFEKGGYIYLLDLKTDSVTKVNIEIAQDFPDAREQIIDVKKNISSYEISPDGKRALFSARGDIFSVPAKKGNIRNLTKSAGVHDRGAVWSPNGKWIAFISDRGGEDEVFIMKPDGADHIQLTRNAKSYRYEPKWSPDSKKLLCSDKSMSLYYIDIQSKKVAEIAKSKVWELRDYAWSPDSKWAAFSDNAENGNSVLYLYSLENAKTYRLTSEFFSSSRPEFSSDGKYLFFVSDRSFTPRLGAFEMSYVYNDMSKIYGLTLQDSLTSPFAFESDEAEITDDDVKDKKKKKKKKKNDEKEEWAIRIDTNGLMDRIFELPSGPANFHGLVSVSEEKLYYVKSSTGKPGALYVYNFEKKKESEAGKITGFEISDNGKHILFRKKDDYYIEKLDDSIKPDKGRLDLKDMKVTLDKKAEWKQIFAESWRQMKYFFYDPNMHGVDWAAVRKQYEALLPYVVHRQDLTYIIGEMIGELNCGHAYAGGGDMPKVKSAPIGLLGADLEWDGPSGYYRIKKIFPGRNWEKGSRSPLTEPGMDINEGDYIISIDGEKPDPKTTPYAALIDKADKYVTLAVNSKPSPAGAKEYNVKTISSEKGLRYRDWVETNRKKVDEATNGKVGYIHIPNMMFEGLNEFVKYFYPQIRKEGLIIDDRFNGGGFVSKMILERLRRVLTMAGAARNQEHVSTYPNAVFSGPMVCLLNEFSASDGDIFPYNFKMNKLGKLIGKRSWGGVIGIRGSLPLLDGGYLYKPEFSHFSADGKWILEGVGMEPDIEIDNDPAKEYEGTDEQLNKAIEVILDEMKKYKGPKRPKTPPHPIKN